LVSFERACVLVVTADVLIGVTGRYFSSVPLAGVSGWLFEKIEHWLEDARSELPMAAQYLSDMAIDTDGNVRARLQALTSSLSQTN
jgi:hypothetical protein